MRIAKLSLACLALVVCAWFALGARQAHQLDQATAIVTQSPPPTAKDLAHASSLISSAETLNPDSQLTLVKARIAHLEHQQGRAERLAEQVTRDEPHNLAAWYELAQVAGSDHVTFFRALGEVNKLDPPPPK